MGRLNFCPKYCVSKFVTVFMQIVCSATSGPFPPDEPLTGPLRVFSLRGLQIFGDVPIAPCLHRGRFTAGEKNYRCTVLTP